MTACTVSGSDKVSGPPSTTASPPRTATAPCSTSARHTCSRKKGLPPVRSNTRRDKAVGDVVRAQSGLDDGLGGGKVQRFERKSRYRPAGTHPAPPRRAAWSR